MRLYSGRCRRPVLVCDGGQPRNVKSRALHALYFGLHVPVTLVNGAACNRRGGRKARRPGFAIQ